MEKKSEAKHGPNSHFVLVHGAGHGAWCWYKIASILQSHGHEVTAIDLAASGVNPIRMEQLESFEDYVQPLTEFLGRHIGDQGVILVGHSLGGGVISFVMERFPEKISMAVFLTAYMPSPEIGLKAITGMGIAKIDDFMDAKIIPEEEDRLCPFHWGLNLLATKLYQHCPPEDLMLASYLVRPIPLSILKDEVKLSTERYGRVRKVFVVCEEDMVIKEDFQRWMIEKNPPEEVKVIEGADHMAMMSKPSELSSLLLDIARDLTQ
ncbi:hypothetical protein MLD38_031214 [Melastoma candidum]|uniref:Uncharacterized protein n=1 Tax=Melastoma candidum TaxID=119954 RepID=A0ACB9MTW1_9MYRT|nr:hypothetical protein MLD38_031214 [Melastoma candidum]